MGQIGQNRNRFYADSVFWRCFARENGYPIGQNRNKREERDIKMERFFSWFFVVAGLYFAWHCLMGGLYIGAILFLLLVLFSMFGVRGNKEK